MIAATSIFRNPAVPSLEMDLNEAGKVFFQRFDIERFEGAPQGFSVTANYAVLKWEFPRTPFVTYEPSDEPWCRELGIGQEVISHCEVTIPNATVEMRGPNAVFRPVVAPRWCDLCMSFGKRCECRA